MNLLYNLYVSFYLLFQLIILVFLHKNIEGNNVNGYISPSYDEESTPGNKIKMKLQEIHKRYHLNAKTANMLNPLLLNHIATPNSALLFCWSAASFTTLDKNYLTPFFTSQNGDEEGKLDLALALISILYCLSNSHCRTDVYRYWIYLTWFSLLNGLHLHLCSFIHSPRNYFIKLPPCSLSLVIFKHCWLLLSCFHVGFWKATIFLTTRILCQGCWTCIVFDPIKHQQSYFLSSHNPCSFVRLLFFSWNIYESCLKLLIIFFIDDLDVLCYLLELYEWNLLTWYYPNKLFLLSTVELLTSRRAGFHDHGDHYSPWYFPNSMHNLFESLLFVHTLNQAIYRGNLEEFLYYNNYHFKLMGLRILCQIQVDNLVHRVRR